MNPHTGEAGAGKLHKLYNQQLHKSLLQLFALLHFAKLILKTLAITRAQSGYYILHPFSPLVMCTPSAMALCPPRGPYPPVRKSLP